MAARISYKPDELAQQCERAYHAIGSATVTASELEVQGLERGKQYWFRVRAVRASQPGPPMLGVRMQTGGGGVVR